MIRSLAISMLLLLFAAIPGYARYSSPAFSNMQVGVTGTQPILNGSIGDYWSPNLTIGGFIGFNVGLGWVEVGFSHGTVEASKPEQPDFTAQFFNIGWDIPFKINPCVAVIPGVVAGNTVMRFDDSGASSSASRETEFTAGGRIALRVCLVEPFFLRTSAEYLHMFSHHPIDQVRYRVSVGASLRTPNWMREVLQ